MGCWNGTCGITGLPILSGMPVRWTVLKRSTYANYSDHGFCHPSEQWTPICGLGKGSYDDYGSVDIDGDDPATRALAEWLSTHLKREPALNVRELIGRDDNEKVADEPDEKEPTPLTVWMAHTEAITALERLYPNPHGAEIESLSLRPDTADDMLRWTWRHDDLPMFGGRSDVNLRNSTMDFRLHVTDQRGPALRALLCGLAEIVWLDTTMCHVRRMWAPQVGAGSQTDDWEEHMALAEVTRSICTAALKHYAEEDGDEDEDEDEE